MKALVLLLAAAVVVPVQAQALPEGKGKDLVATYCSACHGLESVTSQKANKEGWETIIAYMVSRGMSATDEEIKTIVEYLAASFPQAPAPAKPADQDKGQ
jgi:mono/diheme cytochrome c family protein